MKIHFSPLVTQTTVHELKAGAVPVASLERSSGLPGCENRLVNTSTRVPANVIHRARRRHTSNATGNSVESRRRRELYAPERTRRPHHGLELKRFTTPPTRRLERKSRRWLLSLARPRSRRSSPTRASPDAPTALASRPWPPACPPRTSRRPSDPSAASRCVSRVPTGAQGAGKT